MILTALFLATQITAAAAADVPRLNIDASCRAAMKAVIGLSQTMDSCLQSEKSARDQLAKEWDKFVATDRTNCMALTTTGTPGTYTELLTCLEMYRDARTLPKDSNTVGRRGT